MISVVRRLCNFKFIRVPHTLATSWLCITWWFLLPVLPPHQPVPANLYPLGQPLFPALAGADGGGVVEQAVLLFLLRQPGEIGQDGWSGGGRPPCGGGRGDWCFWHSRSNRAPGPKRKLDAPEQGRVGLGVEPGINEIRNLPRMPVQLDHIRPLDLAQIRPGRTPRKPATAARANRVPSEDVSCAHRVHYALEAAPPRYTR